MTPAALQSAAAKLKRRGLTIATVPDAEGVAAVQCDRCGLRLDMVLRIYAAEPEENIGCVRCEGWRPIGEVAGEVVAKIGGGRP